MTRERHAAASRSDTLWRDGSFYRNEQIAIKIGGLPRMTRERHAAASRSDALRRDGSFLSQIPPPPTSHHKIIRRFLINIVVQPVAISGGKPQMMRQHHAAASRSDALRCDGSFYRKFLPPKSNHKIIRCFLINIIIQPIAIKAAESPE